MISTANINNYIYKTSNKAVIISIDCHSPCSRSIMNIINIKRLLLVSLFTLVAYLLVQTLLIMNQRPIKESLVYDRIDLPKIEASNQRQEEVSESGQSFDYEIIGLRINTNGSDSSVIMKKNSNEYVVHIGEYLEGRYLLKSINSNSVIFEAAGREIQLSTEVKP